MRAQYSGYVNTEDLSCCEESLLIDEDESSIVKEGTLAGARRSKTANCLEGKDAAETDHRSHDCLFPVLEEIKMVATDRKIPKMGVCER